MTQPCDCKSANDIATIGRTTNRPGLPALEYRLGTHAAFFEAALRRIGTPLLDAPANSNGEIPRLLSQLKARRTNDPTAALLDAWSVVADIISFYQERIANEGFLDTATERRSLLELAALVGYRARPGVSASTQLAFEVDVANPVIIPKGTSVMSVPESNGSPVTFETMTDLKARKEWNAIQPRLGLPQLITPENSLLVERIYLKGIATNLIKGDPLVFTFANVAADKTIIGEQSEVRWIQQVIAEPAESRTCVVLQPDIFSVLLFIPQIRAALGQLLTIAEANIPDPGEAGQELPPPLKELRDALVPIEKMFRESQGIAAIDAVLTAAKSKIEAAGKPALSDVTDYEDLASIPATFTRTGLTEIGPVREAFLQFDKSYTTAIEIWSRWSTKDFKTLKDGIATIVDVDIANLSTAFPNIYALVLADPFKVFRKFLFETPLPQTPQEVAERAKQLKRRLGQLIAKFAGRKQSGQPAVLADIEKPLKHLRDIFPADKPPIDEDWAPRLDAFIDDQKWPYQQPTELTNATIAALKKVCTQFLLPSRTKWNSDLDQRKSDVKKLFDDAANNQKIVGWLKDFWSPYQAANLKAPLSTRANFLFQMVDVWNDLEKRDQQLFVFVSAVATLLRLQFDIFTLDKWGGELVKVLLATRRVFVDRIQKAWNLFRSQLGGTPAIANEVTGALDVMYQCLTAEKIDTSTFEILVKRVDECVANLIKVLPTITPPSIKVALEALIGELNLATAQTKAPIAPTFGKLPGGPESGLDGLSKAIGFANQGMSDGPAASIDLEDMFCDGANQSPGWMARVIDRLAGRPATDTFEIWRNLSIGTKNTKVFALRQKSPLFGYNAPAKDSEKTPIKNIESTEKSTELFLSDSIDGIVPDSYIVVLNPHLKVSGDKKSPKPEQAFRVFRAESRPRTAYELSGRCTHIDLAAQASWRDEPTEDAFVVLRDTIVYAVSEQLEFADEPIPVAIGPRPADQNGEDSTATDDAVDPRTHIELDDLYPELSAGRALVVEGDRIDDHGNVITRGVESASIVFVEHRIRLIPEPDSQSPSNGVANTMPSKGKDAKPLPGDTPHTEITISPPLRYRYKRSTVRVLANVVEATHGQTQRQTLGDGDAQRPFQQFDLKAGPLTYVSAPTARGSNDELEIRVNGVVWHESEEFAMTGPKDRCYTIENPDEGPSYATFGDGEHGQRLPTGRDNVRAAYRIGLGLAGNVAADRLTQLISHRPGVKKVRNPLPATGGADRDGVTELRSNAPLALSTLDRLVSVSDYEEFARAFAGIGKAAASWLPATGANDGTIHVTITGQNDAPISYNSQLYRNLVTALQTYGDVAAPIIVQNRRLKLLVIAAKLLVDADWLFEDVAARVRSELLGRFGFATRAIAESALPSEALAAIHSVPGVNMADLDLFGCIDEPQPGKTWPDHLTALNEALRKQLNVGFPTEPVESSGPIVVNGSISPGELVYLSDIPETLILTEMTT